MKKYKAIIFDLGNVIFKCTFDHAFRYWADSFNIDYTTIKNKFKIDKAYELFEKNNITLNDYRNHVSNLLDLNFINNEFEIGWNSIYDNVIPGIPELLSKLKNNYKLVALTNTNAVHYPIWINKYINELKFFEKVFSSHLIKTRKPEKESYNFVINYLKYSPSEVVFLDDTNENVMGAISIGIDGILVSSFEGMINDLKALNILIN